MHKAAHRSDPIGPLNVTGNVLLLLPGVFQSTIEQLVSTIEAEASLGLRMLLKV